MQFDKLISCRIIRIKKLALVAASLCWVAGDPTIAQQSTMSEEPQSNGSEVVFVPPASGAPADRVGAATRDVGQEGSLLTLLAPAGGGLTTLDHPPLVWRLGATFAGQMHAQLAPVGQPNAGVVKATTSRFRKGYYALDLARSDLELRSGVIYEWKVFLIDADTSNVVDQKSTFVEFIATQEGAGASDATAAAALGLWFDALAPFVEVGLSGKVRIAPGGDFAALATSAGLSLP